MRYRLRPAATFCVITIAWALSETVALAGSTDHCACADRAEIAAQLAQAQAFRDVYQREAEHLQTEEKQIQGDLDRLLKVQEEYKAWLSTGRGEEMAREAGAQNPKAGDIIDVANYDDSTCTMNLLNLDAAASKEACLELSGILIDHENYHDDVCKATRAKFDGKTAPTRHSSQPIDEAVNAKILGLPSGEALDEVGAYKLQIGELTKLLSSLRCGGWTGTISYKVVLQDQGENAPLTNWSRHKAVDVQITLIGGVGTAHSTAAITNISASRQYKALGGGQKEIIAIGSSSVIGDVGGTTPASVDFEPVNGAYNFEPVWKPLDGNAEAVDCDHDRCTKRPQQFGTYPVEIPTLTISGTTDDPAHVHGHLDGGANVIPPGHWFIDWDLKRDPGGPTP